MAVNRDKVLREAERLVQRGKIAGAVKEYEKLLAANPNDTATINRIGDLYTRVGEIDKAVELYRRIADHFVEDGFHAKAIAILKKINRLAPKQPQVLRRLADLYLHQGLNVEARSRYQELVDWYVEAGEPAEAVELQRRLVQIDPGDHMAHLRLADLLIASGETEQAYAVYDRLGAMLLERERLDEAERLYRHLLEQSPRDGTIFVRFCRAMLDAGRIPTADEFVEAAWRLSPDDPDLRAMRVRVLSATGRRDEAISLAEEVLEEDPERAEVRALVGEELVAAGRYDEAREALLPVVDDALARGDAAEARRCLQLLLDEREGDAQVLSRAVRAWEGGGDGRSLLDLKSALARAFESDGDLDRARLLYAELAAAQPEREEWSERAEELGERVAGDEASGPEPTPGAGGPRTAVTTDEVEERMAEARVFAKYGLVDKAIRHLEELLAVDPGVGEARSLLAELGAGPGGGTAPTPTAGAAAPPVEEEAVPDAVDFELEAPPPETAGSPAAVAEGAAAVEPPADEAVEPEAAATAVERVDSGEFLLEFEPVPETEKPVPPEPSPEPGPSWSAVGEEAAAGDAEPDAESFPLPGDEAERELPAAVAAAEGWSPVPDESPAEEEVRPPVAAAPTPPEEEPEGDVPDELRSALAQLDFFLEQELYSDAVRVLRQLEERPEPVAGLDERRAVLRSKGALLDDLQPPVAREEADELFAAEDDFFDLAKELEAELAEEEEMVQEATGRGQQEAELEEVFREFRKGVAEQLSDEDADTHFNLGIAYMEMELLTEAISEFQIAARDPNYALEACSMTGSCYLKLGMPDRAVEWYRRALEIPGLADPARLGLLYDLGGAHEAIGDADEAVEVFGRIVEADPSYRDAADRLRDLGRQQQQVN